jgi:Flp pilus assembly protein TadD
VTELRADGGDKDVKTLLSVAQLYEKSKRYDDMGKTLDEAEKRSKSKDDTETVHFMRGAMFEHQKKYDASEAEFRKVLDGDPENAGALNYLGYMLADRGVRLEEAGQMIKKALDLDPENGAYLDSMGWALYRQGKLDEAQNYLLKAIDKMGKDPTIHDHLGDVYLKMGKTREAISQWQASLKEYQSGNQSDADPDDIAKVNRKLDDARVKLAQETKKQK